MKSFVNWLKFVILRTIVIKRYGREDFRICRYSLFGEKSLTKSYDDTHWWCIEEFKRRNASFKTLEEAQERLNSYYGSKGEIVDVKLH